MNVHELFQAGKLTDAVAELTAAVKKNPTNMQNRSLLCEFMMIRGQFERADTQLDLMAHQLPEQAAGIALYRQLVRAAKLRDQFYAEGRVPEVLAEPNSQMKNYFRASISLREGKLEEANEIFSTLDQDREKLSGQCNGVSFADFRDLDDRTSTMFEALTSTGKYYWIPFELVSQVTFHPPERPLDLLWRRATFETKVENGAGDVYVPATYYCNNAELLTDKHQLGHITDWLGDENEPARGIGQRLFFSGDDAVSIMEIQELCFN